MYNIKNERIKIIWISILLLIFLSNSTVIYADDDTSEGSAQIDTDNDAPSFVLVFDSVELVEPDTNIVFYTIIEDVDNDSTELIVTLYYSDDSFVIHNVSQSMSYVSSPQADQYRYEYIFLGQPAGVYYQYYYQVEDGYSNAKDDNSGSYYDIQWETTDYIPPEPRNTKPKEVPIEPTEPAKANYTELILVIIFAGAIIIVIIIDIVFNEYKQLNKRWTKK